MTTDEGFATEITLTGPWRAPAQMLEEQRVGGRASIHDAEAASALQLRGAPIEGPTHFSQFDPLAAALWGRAWFEHGCISAHFRTMVVEGEEVQASLSFAGGGAAAISARKRDESPVLVGSASIGPAHPPSALDERLSSFGDPGELFVVDQLEVGMRSEDEAPVAITHADRNGAAYPFSLDEKLARITEPHPWYTPDGGAASPWGRPVLPMEMVSVLAHKSGGAFPVRSPVVGLFLDLEVRLLDGPVFVDQEYAVRREIVGIGQSRRTESYWTRTDLTDTATGRVAASVLLHSGVFKESYPGYPKERLPS